jgi:DNA-binding LacI/PurR family transcriptional regulator
MTRLAYQRLHNLGYRRIGMAVGLHDEAMTDDLYAGAYCIEQYKLPVAKRIPPLHFGYHETFAESAVRLRTWTKRYHMDAIMSNWANILALAHEAGLPVPEEVACACLSIGTVTPKLAGVVPNYRLVGSKAAESLALCLKTGQRGIPSLPTSTHVEGYWIDGASAPPLK